MKKQLFILPLLFIFSTFSCKKNESQEVQKNSEEVSENTFKSKVFNFNYPEDWSITDSEEIEKGIYYLAIEKKGLDASGLMTVVSFEELIDKDASIQINIEQLQNNPVINNLEYGPLEDATFNSLESRVSSFHFKTMGLKHEGMIYALTSKNYSVVILKQEALEDKKDNAEGFYTIENSFSIN
jgi:RecA-family ATPase